MLVVISYQKKLDDFDVSLYAAKNGIDIYTIEDIVKCLKQPNRDFRDDFEKPLLKSDILKIEDLKSWYGTIWHC